MNGCVSVEWRRGGWGGEWDARRSREICADYLSVHHDHVYRRQCAVTCEVGVCLVSSASHGVCARGEDWVSCVAWV